MSLKTNVSSKILMLGIAILTIFNSCKKDDGGGGGGTPQPAIASFTPTSGTTGTTVTITGTNFTGTTAVKFGNVAATSFNVVNATTITAVVGSGATGDVSVTTAGGTTSKGTFTYNTTPPVNAPTITSFTPTSGTTGTSVTITGTNLTGATVVKFGNTNATSFNVVNATTITAVVGSGATGKVSVTTPGGTANSTGDFTFNTTPSGNNLTSKISGDSELSQLNTGIGVAQLGSTLNGAGPFTVLAPVNSALSAYGLNLGTLDQATNNSVIRYHILNGKFLTSDFPVAENTKYTTINTPADSVFITKTSTGSIFVNGINVDNVKKDILADNGVIHKLNGTDGFLFPPVRNVYDQLSRPGYDSIKKIVDRAALADATLLNLLRNSVVTVVAPTNAAFTEFFAAQPATGVKEINKLTSAAALALVKDHIIVSRRFIINLANAGLNGVPAYGGLNLKFGNVGGQPAFYYTSTGSPLGGVYDIMCFNGVVHRSTKLLLR